MYPSIVPRQERQQPRPTLRSRISTQTSDQINELNVPDINVAGHIYDYVLERNTGENLEYEQPTSAGISQGHTNVTMPSIEHDTRHGMYAGDVRTDSTFSFSYQGPDYLPPNIPLPPPNETSMYLSSEIADSNIETPEDAAYITPASSATEEQG